jgi:CubicO group peptidase (beta-lactamase class C family)
MKKSIIVLALWMMFNPANAQQKATSPGTAAFDKIIEAQFPVSEPGAAVLVSRNGKIIYQRAIGMANLELNVPMQNNNVFRIGSITKQFTAMAILQLMEKGKLNVQDEITKFIPGYSMQGYKITIEHLLTHTSGIQDFTSIKDNVKRIGTDYTPKEMIAYFKDTPMRFAPGTKWEYSNSNYALLGYIIELVSGSTYGQYLQENIFQPAGMNNSSYAAGNGLVKNRVAGYSRGDKDFENAYYISMTQPYAAGAILSTAEDLFKWNQALQANTLLKKETLAKAFTKYKLNDGTEANYGYGWRFGYVQESPTIWHGGLINGFRTIAMYLPKEDVYVAVLSNCDCQFPETATERLAALAIGKPYDHKLISVDTATLAGYTGVYENDKGQQRIISLSGTVLNSQVGRSPKARINAFQADKFFFQDDPMQTLEFSRNKNNQVEKLIVHSRTANEPWRRTNKAITADVEIKVDEKILETYVGEYEIRPEFSFIITKQQDRLFLKGTGQEAVEIFAETPTKFFLKVNGAQLEFVKDDSGKIVKAILTQGNRQTDAKKIKP